MAADQKLLVTTENGIKRITFDRHGRRRRFPRGRGSSSQESQAEAVVYLKEITVFRNAHVESCSSSVC
jgi:hypothetical protein